MDKLPPELIHGIASHLPRPLAGYATISSSWQHAIELRTFAAVTAYSGRVLFGQFKAVFAAVRRRTLLRNLEFYAKLPLRAKTILSNNPRPARRRPRIILLTPAPSSPCSPSCTLGNMTDTPA